MEVHGDYVIAAGSLKHIGHELSGDWGAGLVLLVLARVWEVWNHGCDAACRCCFTRVDHNEEFHESIVDVSGWGRLQDEDCHVVNILDRSQFSELMPTILVADRLADSYRSLLVRILKYQNLGKFYA